MFYVYKEKYIDQNGDRRVVMFWTKNEAEYHDVVATFATYQEVLDYMNTWLEAA